MKKNNSQFLQNVQQAIHSEAAAVALYTALHGALSADSEAAPVLRRIVEEEERHLKGFSDLYRSRTGRRYEPEIKHIPFYSIRHGIRMALQEELAAQDLYSAMYLTAPAEARDFLHHTRGDENLHSLWLLYLLHGLQETGDDEPADNGRYQQAFICRKEANTAAAAIAQDPVPMLTPMAAMPPAMHM
jgi:rubrerythrin